jgi:hypothetical protein
LRHGHPGIHPVTTGNTGSDRIYTGSKTHDKAPEEYQRAKVLGEHDDEWVGGRPCNDIPPRGEDYMSTERDLHTARTNAVKPSPKICGPFIRSHEASDRCTSRSQKSRRSFRNEIRVRARERSTGKVGQHERYPSARYAMTGIEHMVDGVLRISTTFG